MFAVILNILDYNEICIVVLTVTPMPCSSPKMMQQSSSLGIVHEEVHTKVSTTGFLLSCVFLSICSSKKCTTYANHLRLNRFTYMKLHAVGIQFISDLFQQIVC